MIADWRALGGALLLLGLATALLQAQGVSPESGPDGAALGRIALGFLLASAGSVALVLALAYKGPVRLTLFSFGMFALLYGTRILIVIPAIAQLVGLSRRSIFFAVAWINYLLPAFGLLFAEQIRGPGWMNLLRRFWQAAFVLGTAFIVVDAVRGAPWASFGVYRVFLLVAMTVLLGHVVVWRHRDPVETGLRTFGTAVLALAVIHDNVAALLPWNVSLEVYGVSVFTFALGAVTARRFFADQRDLAAVERELENARTIQAAILPRELPRVPGLRLAVRYIPARSVAGDVYGFLPVGEAQLGVLVADVSGHGVPAALIASMATVAFSSQRTHAADPSRTLAEINRVIVGHFDARFVTAAYAFFDTSESMLAYSLAGHPPPLLVRAGGSHLMDLDVGSTVLGLFEDAQYPSAIVRLAPGDRVVFYTDGLTEVASPAGEWFGERELKRFATANAALPPERFIDALLARLQSWSGNPRQQFDDDLTVLVVDVA